MFVHVPQPLLYPIPFLVSFFPVLVILPSFLPQLQGPIIVCTVFAYPSFVDLACGPSMPQGGSDDTCFLQINQRFLVFYFLHSIFLPFSLKYNTLHLFIPVLFVGCGYGMHPTVFHELHVHSISGTSNFLIAVPNIRSMLSL